MATAPQQRTAAELKNPEFNYFIAFKIELNEKDKNKIDAKIKTALSSTSGSVNGRRLLELKNDINEIMLNDATCNKGVYTPNSGGRAKEAAAAKTFKLNEAISIIEILCQTRKKLLKSDLLDICNTANKPVTYFTEAEFFKAIARFKGMGVEIIDNVDTQIPFSEFQQVEKLLEPLNKKDLYDFLGLSQSASTADIQKKSDELYRDSSKTSDLKKKQSVSQLCSKVKKLLLSDAQGRKAYEQYLLLQKDVWDQFAQRKNFGIKEITTEEYEKYTQTVKSTLKVSTDEAEKIIGIGCKYFQFNIVGGSGSGALETCPFCGELIPKGSKNCKHCGKQLETICWNCKQSIRASRDDKPCPVCGATSYTQTLLNDRCSTIDRMLSDKNAKLPEMEAALTDLKTVLPNYDKRINSTVAQKVKEYNIKLDPKRNLAQLEATRAQKKKKRRAAIIAGSSFGGAAVAVFLVILFIFLIPLWSMIITTSQADDGYTVTGLKDRAIDTTTELVIEETVPQMIFAKKKTVVAIGSQAFYANRVLQKVTLPKTITSIGGMAFANCAALTTVFINSIDPPQLADNAFVGTDAMLYVPEDSYERYVSASGWSRYSENIFPFIDGVTDTSGLLVYLADSGTFANGKDYYLYPAYPFGGTLTAVDAPTRLGYTFEGWRYIEGGQIRELTADTTFDRSYKLHAQWSPNPFTITFKYESDVTLPEGTTLPDAYNIEIEVELPVPTRLGYTFNGWRDESTGKVFDTKIPKGTTGNLVLSPVWEAQEYNFRFVSVGSRVADATLKTGDAIDVVPARPTSGKFATGYVFAGWSTSVLGDANGDSAHVVKKIPPFAATDDVIMLYAVWDQVPDDWFVVERMGTSTNWYVTGLNENWYNYTGERSYLYLPEKLSDGWPISGIAANAFYGNTEIKAVDIPSSYHTIEDYAFYGCTNLSNVMNGSEVFLLGEHAFIGTYWLENKWNDATNKPWFLSLGHVALKYDFTRPNALNVTAEDFPAGVRALGEGLFKNLGAGTTGGTIVLPDDVWQIRSECFANSGFTNFTFAYVLGFDNAFAGITKIDTLTYRYSKLDFEEVFKNTLKDGLTIGKLTIEFEGRNDVILNGRGYVSIGSLLASGMMADGIRNNMVITSAEISGFVKINEINMSYNSIQSFNADGIEIGTLNLRNCSLWSLDVTNLHAYNLILVGNALSQIVCAEVNESIRIIYMPEADGYSYSSKISDLNFAEFLPNLLSLDVANQGVSDLRGLLALENLVELYLGGNPVLNDYNQMAQLAEAPFLSKLVRLNLGGGSATTQILQVVSKCNNLEWLQIYGIGASESQITSTISRSTHAKLKYLKISHNGFFNVPSSLNYINTVVIDYDDNRQEDQGR